MSRTQTKQSTAFLSLGFLQKNMILYSLKLHYQNAFLRVAQEITNHSGTIVTGKDLSDE